MGNDAITEWLEENEAPEFIQDAFNGSKLRQQLAAQAKEIEEYKPFKGKYESLQKAPARQEVAKELGFDTKNKTVSKALGLFDYEGEAPDKDALAAYLTDDWGLTPTPSIDQPEAQKPSGAQVIAAAQGGTALGTPIPQAADIDAQIKAAEQAGDFVTSMRLKTAKQLGTAS